MTWLSFIQDLHFDTGLFNKHLKYEYTVSNANVTCLLLTAVHVYGAFHMHMTDTARQFPFLDVTCVIFFLISSDVFPLPKIDTTDNSAESARHGPGGEIVTKHNYVPY